MSLDTALLAMGDQTRRRILNLVGRKPRPAGELAAHFSVSRPAVSKHLRVLREAGLLEATKSGRHNIYQLRPGGLQEAKQWISDAEQLWDSALERFRTYVESAPPGWKEKGK